MKVVEIALTSIGLMISLIVFADTLPSLAPRRRRRHWRPDAPALPRERLQLLASAVATTLLVSTIFYLLN